MASLQRHGIGKFTIINNMLAKTQLVIGLVSCNYALNIVFYLNEILYTKNILLLKYLDFLGFESNKLKAIFSSLGVQHKANSLDFVD